MKWYQLAYAARLYQRGGGWIELSREDFAGMVRNFERNPNGFVRVEGGDHGSPHVVGKITALEVRDGVNAYTGQPAATLWGLIDWTPDALGMIKAGNWSAVSIEAHPHRDPITGEPAGRRLSAVALLPPDAEFLKGMEPIAASEAGKDDVSCAERTEPCKMMLSDEAAKPGDDGKTKTASKGEKMDWEQVLTMLRGGADLADDVREEIAAFVEAQKAIAETAEAETAAAKEAAQAAEAAEVKLAEGAIKLTEAEKAVVKLSDRVAKLEAERREIEVDKYLDGQAKKIEPAERPHLRKLLLSDAGEGVKALIEARGDRPELAEPGAAPTDSAPTDGLLALSERVEKIVKDKGLSRQDAYKLALTEKGNE